MSNGPMYVVQIGDTIHRIARKYKIAVHSLLQANPQLALAEQLRAGQMVAIPPQPPSYYMIQRGDTFHAIAEGMNVSIPDLLEANPGIQPSRLLIGQTIVIPAGRAFRVVSSHYEYGYQELEEDLSLLSGQYPFLQLSSIGNSVIGKPLYAIRIGTGSKEIHYNGGIHANEWITSLMLMTFLEDYAMAVRHGRLLRGVSAAKLYEEVSLWVVPMLNPDGTELVLQGCPPGHPHRERLLEWNGGSQRFQRWKANIRGVDLNDQFPASWEEERRRRNASGPGPCHYGGTAPLTEPEAEALVNFTREHDFASVFAFHTQGREIYWNYRGLEPSHSENAARLLGQASGYRPVKLTESDAGYKDWFIQEYRRPGFTIESGVGVNPLPLEQFAEMYEDTIGIMVHGLLV